MINFIKVYQDFLRWRLDLQPIGNLERQSHGNISCIIYGDIFVFAQYVVGNSFEFALPRRSIPMPHPELPVPIPPSRPPVPMPPSQVVGQLIYFHIVILSR